MKKVTRRKKARRGGPGAEAKPEVFPADLKVKPARPILTRTSFARARRTLEVPALYEEHQTGSYEQFLKEGIATAFHQMFPVPHEPDVEARLEYVRHRLEPPTIPWEDCKERGLTYAHSLFVTFRLNLLQSGEIREQEVYLGEIPAMTERASFIVNGTERVIVSQVIRSPGLYFKDQVDMKGRRLFSARLVPSRGTWLEMGFDTANHIYARLGKTRRVGVTTLLTAMDFEIEGNVIRHKDVEFRVPVKASELESWLPPLTIVDPVTGEVLVSAYSERISELTARRIERAYAHIKDATIRCLVPVREIPLDLHESLQKTWKRDAHKNRDDALKALYTAARPTETSPTKEVALEHLKNRVFNRKNYDLSEVGRFQVSNKLQLFTIPPRHFTMTPLDVIEVLYALIDIQTHGGVPDDVDHLSNRRVRLPGELILEAFRNGLQKAERSIREKIARGDMTTAMPHQLINTRLLTTPLRGFFNTGRLTQYLDQTNPLAELTHKRRLSALGPGGLTRDRAGFEVRDVQYSHYGKICPIETPEGPNIGLITSLATYARVAEFGFLRTPYFKVENGRVTDKIEYLTADEEDRVLIADATTPTDENGYILADHVSVRSRGTLLWIKREEVNYMDASPAQITGASAALIPFLEHDDANRALMGANMLRQAVPLTRPTPPVIGTGMERVVARNSGYLIFAEEDGVVERVTGDEIHIRGASGVRVYRLRRFRRSNQGTIIDQVPRVRRGDKVSKGDILVNAQGIVDGELALGNNLLVAFLPMEGYNFEDAIVVSERLVKEEIFSSIHIEDYETETRRTKLGHEIITRDIPNVPEDLLRNLDDTGVVRLGTVVKSGDILVGKLTPKPPSDKTPEEALLLKITGSKLQDFKHTSRKLPHGSEGWVIDVQRFSRKEGKELPAGVEELVRVYVGVKRRLQVGDKLSGRHGNKGVIAKIMPVEDMPFLEDGTPVDLIFSPLCIPSRMNLGQLFELHMGWAAANLNLYAECPIFVGPTEEEIRSLLRKAGLPESGKTILYDGRTGLPYEEPVTVGVMYVMKLYHLAAEKIHARSTGSYTLVTQQPLGGKAQFGGQRFGEMEVWALQAYGASEMLQEMLTIKSDDIEGRWQAYRAITKGADLPYNRMPESFNVLVKELQGLCLDLKFYRRED
ncbi:MAG: DNA-directed RNA polymerase subunit beta [bacterium JZ-2024 1]